MADEPMPNEEIWKEEEEEIDEEGEDWDQEEEEEKAEAEDQRSQEAKEEEKNGVEEKWFQCYNCNWRERYEVKGQTFPPVKNIRLKEPSYIMADPFSEQGQVNILILGSDCAVCKQPICQSPDCSIYFLKRYCQKCALANKHCLPAMLHRKLKLLPPV